ncbi:MAG: alpha-amylase family glycosyl hydrolase [Ferruginibacter sp.]
MLTSLNDIQIATLSAKTFTPSPIAWEDQVLYFLMLDRFSDNNEAGFAINGTTPLFTANDKGNAITSEADAKTWRDAGNTFAGGNLKGLTNKIDYLKGLGITTIWISPVFKQVAIENSYHGYGIQNFLETDPNFGTKEDLKEMVDKAHVAGIYVILDIILNHTGNVFSYKNSAAGHRWNGGRFEVEGFNDRTGMPAIPFRSGVQAEEEDAIWPIEFQDPACFTQKGAISNWDFFPEFLEGDFFNLKDVFLGSGGIDNYTASKALKDLCKVYKYWIAFADIDGYRVDTVKHMDPGAARIFASEIHEFAQKIGKENFYLVGEITGSRENAFTTLETTGMDAALGIADIQEKMEYAIKGFGSPKEYFNLFRNSVLVGKESHTWFKNKVVTMFDDHDKVSEGENKTRFCADFNGDQLMLIAMALNVTTMGIPCIYYGSEQLFDGEGRGNGSDRYIRESMFGGKFGPFRSKGRHLFNKNQTVYKELAKILTIRKNNVTLRRGRQYLREISGDGNHFGLPDFLGNALRIRSVIPWSRLLDDEEIVLAINTDLLNELSVWVTVDNTLNNAGESFKCIYCNDITRVGNDSPIEIKNGKAIKISVPAAGFVIYKKD